MVPAWQFVSICAWYGNHNKPVVNRIDQNVEWTSRPLLLTYQHLSTKFNPFSLKRVCFQAIVWSPTVWNIQNSLLFWDLEFDTKGASPKCRGFRMLLKGGACMVVYVNLNVAVAASDLSFQITWVWLRRKLYSRKLIVSAMIKRENWRFDCDGFLYLCQFLLCWTLRSRLV